MWHLSDTGARRDQPNVLLVIDAYHARAARLAPPDMLAWLHSARPGAVPQHGPVP
jgi:hypothetical protein